MFLSFAVTADIQGLEGNRIPVQGLQNGQQYICTMVARAVTGGVLPRAVNSEPSNPTPAFTPSATSTGSKSPIPLANTISCVSIYVIS